MARRAARQASNDFKCAHLRLNLALRVQVRLIAGQGDDNVGVALSLQLLHPLLCALEGVLWRRQGCSLSAGVRKVRRTGAPSGNGAVPACELAAVPWVPSDAERAPGW